MNQAHVAPYRFNPLKPRLMILQHEAPAQEWYSESNPSIHWTASFRQVQDVYLGWSRVIGMQSNRPVITMRAFWDVSLGYLTADGESSYDDQLNPDLFRSLPPQFNIDHKELSQSSESTDVLQT